MAWIIQRIDLIDHRSNRLSLNTGLALLDIVRSSIGEAQRDNFLRSEHSRIITVWCRQIVNTTDNRCRLTCTGSSNDQRGRTRSGESITLLRGIEIRQRLHRGGSRSRNSSVRRQLMIQRGQSISHQQTQIDLREGVNILRKGCCQLGVNSGDLIKRDRIVVNVNQGLCQKRNRFVLVNIRCSSDETVVDISHSDLLMQAHPQGGKS